MGYPAAIGRRTSRTDATRHDAMRARDLAPTAFRRRNSSRISRRQKAVGSSSRSTGMGHLFVCVRRAWRSGEKGGRGESPAQKHGRVCADRLAKKRIAHASDVFIGAVATVLIKSDSPLRQSVDWKPQLSASRGSRFSNYMGGELPFSLSG
jgi:hypothetical protein